MEPTEVFLREAGSVLTIDLAALVSNWHTLQAVSGTECGAVVKADAYGLGLERVARALLEAGCKTFFTGHVFEGRALRAIAPDAIIYVLNGIRPGSEFIFADFQLRPVLGSVPQMEDWGQFCATSGKRAADGSLLKAALQLDTGVNQLGLKACDLERADHLAPLFDVTLLLGQLAIADNDLAERQIEAFDAMRARYPGKPASIANSAAIFLDTNPPLYELVRPGYALYGGNPVPGRPNPMRPVVKLEAQIVQVRVLEPGQGVGEEQRWIAKGPRRIIMVAAGLADGIPAGLTRNEKNRGGEALVQGTRCPYVSKIAMDYSVIDVSDATYLERGEWVELIGKTVTIDEFAAAAAGLSGYEILTRLGQRAHRRYQAI